MTRAVIVKSPSLSELAGVGYAIKAPERPPEEAPIFLHPYPSPFHHPCQGSLSFFACFVRCGIRIMRRMLSRFGQLLEGLYERRSSAAQLGAVMEGKPVKNLITLAGQYYEHLPAVAFRMSSAHKAALYCPVDKLHRAVMLEAEPLCQITNGDWTPLREALDRQEQLVLLRLKSCATRHLLAEAGEPSQIIPELGKCPVFLGCESVLSILYHRIYVVVRYMLI